jgi:hypothetical protein
MRSRERNSSAPAGACVVDSCTRPATLCPLPVDVLGVPLTLTLCAVHRLDVREAVDLIDEACALHDEVRGWQRLRDELEREGQQPFSECPTCYHDPRRDALASASS